MMNWKMHIKLRKNSTLVFIILLSLLISCSTKDEENYVVKVGESYLTESMIKESLSSLGDSNKFREEFIREWIEAELIYLDALKNGTVDSEEYQRLLAKAKVEIANALAIKKILTDNSIDIVNKKLENYYVNNISEFKVASPRLVYNQVTFTNRKVANNFRNVVVDQGWKNSVNQFSNEGIDFSVVENKIEYVYNMLNENLRKQFFRLSKNELSRVFATSKNTFAIIQLLKRYNKNDVPEFEEIKGEIEQKYFSLKRKKLYSNYLKELYSKYSFEIVR